MNATLPLNGSDLAHQHKGAHEGDYIDMGGKGTAAETIFNLEKNETNLPVYVRYSNGDNKSRPVSLHINGLYIKEVDLTPTGGWEKWSVLKISSFSMLAGDFFIRLTASTDAGGPNIDYIHYEIIPEETQPPVPPIVIPPVNPGGGDTTPRKKITLTKPYNGSDIFLENLEIDCNNLTVLAKSELVKKVKFKNVMLYNFNSINEHTTSQIDMTWEDVILADLILDKKTGKTYRGVKIPEYNKLTGVMTNRMDHLQIQKGAGKRYGIYVEDKNSIASTVTWKNVDSGSLEYEHDLRLMYNVNFIGNNVRLANWLNIDKGDQTNGGSASRLHNTNVTIKDFLSVWSTKFGKADWKMKNLVLENAYLFGHLGFEGVNSKKFTNVFHNGKKI